MSRDVLARASRRPARAGTARLSRRELLGTAGALLPAAVFAQSSGNAGEPPAARSTPRDVSLAGPALLDAFMKMHAATDGRIVTGWLDGVTYAVIDGETFPLYRLYAATWYRFRRATADRYEGQSLEVAFFHDLQTNEPLTKLTMPRTGNVVDVPLYRAGPSQVAVQVRQEQRREFAMANETRQGTSFFRPGVATTRQWLSQPQRDGSYFSCREDLDTRVTPGDPSAPGFFYREWTTRRAPWDVVMNPASATAPTEVFYSALAAYRPWMKMGNAPGHTTQNGQGGKVQRGEDLPDTLRALCRQHHPDLLDAPNEALDARHKTG
jgi:hypothetical protein